MATVSFASDYQEGAHPAILERLSQTVGFSYWERRDNEHSVVRFATSWATTAEQTEQLIAELA